MALLAIPISLFVMMSEPHMQTVSARLLAGYLSEKFGTTITIEKFYFGIDLSLQIKGLEVHDMHHQTMLRAETIELHAFPSDFSKKLEFSYVRLANVNARLMQYAGENHFNYQFIADFFSTNDTVSTGQSVSYPISVSSFRLENAAFAYVIEEDTLGLVDEMDYNNLQISDISLRISNLNIVGDSISGDLRQLKAKEKSGIELVNLKGKVKLTSKQLQVEQMSLSTPNSSFEADLKFHYDSYWAYTEFIDSVRIEADVRSSSLYLADIGVFAPVMYEMPDLIVFSGRLYGTVADFKASQMNLSFGDNTELIGNISMRGLPDFFSSDIDLHIDRMQCTAYDIKKFRIPIEGGYIPLPDLIDQAGLVQLSGVFHGKYEDFATRVNLNSRLGNARAEMVYRTNPITGLVHYNLSLNADNIQMGLITNDNKHFGSLSANLLLTGKGLDLKTGNANLEGNIRRFDLLGNHFQNIPVKAELSDQQLSLDTEIQDVLLRMKLAASADFKGEQPSFLTHGKVGYADLAQLHLLDIDTLNRLAVEFDAAFSGNTPDSLTGFLHLSNINYLQGKNALLLKTFDAELAEDILLGRRFTANSDLFDFEMGGKFKVATLFQDVNNLIAHYVRFGFLQPFDSTKMTTDNQDFYFNARLKDVNTLLPFVLPSWELAPNTSLSGVFTQRTNSFNATFRSEWINAAGVKMETPYLLVQTDRKNANLKFELSDLVFKDAASENELDFGMESPRLILDAANDQLDFRLSWNNHREKLLNKGVVLGHYCLDSLDNGILKFVLNDVIINDSAVRLNTDHRLVFGKEHAQVDHFRINVGNSTLTLNGNLPLHEQDSLIVDFHQWDMSFFDIITATAGFDLDGIVDGDLVLNNLLGDPYFSSNLHITDLGLNKEKLGDARIINNFSNANQSIYSNVQIVNRGNTSNSRMLNLRGFYYPAKEKNSLDFELSLQNFKLKVLNPFFEGIISQLEGHASGEFSIRGELAKPLVEGKLNLTRTAFLVDYLNVKYSLQHELEIKPTTIPLKNLILYDSTGHTAVVNGLVRHKHLLSGWELDLSIKPQTMLALNTGPKQNELFYGSAVATGEIIVKGPLDDVDMAITAISEKGTNIVIPLNTAGTVGSSDFIRFLTPADSLTAKTNLLSPPAPINSTGFKINLNTTVTPDAFVKIYLPYDMGSLEARGNGNIAMGVDDIGNFTLNGDYIVQNGLFTFTFENYLKKKFNLTEGGRITWTGDPYEADLDVKGVYRVKASLAGLGIDTTSSLRGRINVDCIIHLTNDLFNPDIRFAFKLPGADADLEQRVFSVIDTTNDAAMTQQMVSLLVLGSFASSNIGGGSFTNSTFEMISSQVGSLLSQISNDFDIGFNYRPGDELSNEELEVALSTQLFNERVSIEGNFGMSNKRNVSQNASNIVGDVDVSVKLNDDGSFRMKAFNHSNHSSWLNYGAFDNYSPYTQGIGVSYRQEFDAFNEIFRRKRTKQRTRP